MIQSLTVCQFVEQLGKTDTQPGGGSAAALMGLTGVALLQMALGYSHTTDDGLYKNLQGQLELLHQDMLEYLDADPVAFAEFLAVQQLPQNTPEEQVRRVRNTHEALLKAIEVPMKIANTCNQALSVANRALTLQLAEEAYCEFIMAFHSLGAGFFSALACVMSNLATMEQNTVRQRIFMKMVAEKKVAMYMLSELEKFFGKNDKFRLIHKDLF